MVFTKESNSYYYMSGRTYFPIKSKQLNFFQRNVYILVIFLFIPMVLFYWRFKVDDAYISFVYAKNFIQGNGITYNGTVVEGYSNFLWMLIIAPFIALKLEPLLVARILSIVSACGCIVITEKLIYRFNPQISPLMTWLALLSVAICAPFAAWTVGGLETIFLGFLVVLFVYYEVQTGWMDYIFSQLIVLAAALTRPEGFMLFPIMIIYRCIYKGNSHWQALLSSLIFVIPFVIFLFWRYTTYGYFLPNTAYLKLNSNLDTSINALKWLSDFFALRPLFALVIGVGIICLIRERKIFDSNWSLVVMVITAFGAFVLYSCKDWMPHHRFIAPILALFGLFVGRTMTGFTRKSIRLLVVSATIGAIVIEVILAITLFIPLSPQLGDYTDGLINGGKWIHENTPPDITIAVVDAGALAYYSERHTIDIIGLNDEHIAHSSIKVDPV